MKLNIACPATGQQKLIEIEDERVLRPFFDKRMGAIVEGDAIGEEWKGYQLKITGGNDKQGFPMKQGVLTNNRVRLLLSAGHSCYRPRRKGERKRKSVRGCIVDSNLSVLALTVYKKGEKDIPGLTDSSVPKRLGPKRATGIRKLFNLTKEDDVRKHVIRRAVQYSQPREGKKQPKKPKVQATKIQRLITPQRLQRKRRRMAEKRERAQKRKEETTAYAALLAKRYREAKQKKDARRKRLSSARTQSTSSE